MGSVLVRTDQDDVEVYLDDKLQKSKTQHGQLHIPGLATTMHKVRVAKDGFSTPDTQTVQIVKGQEAKLQFDLKEIPRSAALELERLPAGVQVLLDGTPIGVVGANGMFSHTGINPGEHTIQFAQQGFPPVRISKRFTTGETQKISDTEVTFKHAQGTLDVTLSPNMAVTVLRGKQEVGRLTTSGKLPLEEGTYAVIVRSPNGSENTQTVTVEAGVTRPFDLRISSDSEIMEQWTGKWTKQDQWYQRKGGGFILYKGQRLSGNVRFTVKLPHSHIFSGSQHLRWVVNFIDDKNYLLFELDNKYLTRTEVVDGNKQAPVHIKHSIPNNAPFMHLDIQISPNVLLQRYSLQDNDWVTLDNYDRSGATPTLYQGKARNLTDGQFGFSLPANEGVELSNFNFAPQGRR